MFCMIFYIHKSETMCFKIDKICVPTLEIIKHQNKEVHEHFYLMHTFYIECNIFLGIHSCKFSLQEFK